MRRVYIFYFLPSPRQSLQKYWWIYSLHVSTYPVSGDVLPLRKFDFDMAGGWLGRMVCLALNLIMIFFEVTTGLPVIIIYYTYLFLTRTTITLKGPKPYILHMRWLPQGNHKMTTRLNQNQKNLLIIYVSH